MVHFCVPNVPGAVPRTATHAINNAVWPCIRQIAEAGLEAAVAAIPCLARGIATKDGEITNEPLAAAYYAGMGSEQ